MKPIYQELKRRKILVRYMNYEGYGDGLRISVGTDADLDKLLYGNAQHILGLADFPKRGIPESASVSIA